MSEKAEDLSCSRLQAKQAKARNNKRGVTLVYSAHFLEKRREVWRGVDKKVGLLSNCVKSRLNIFLYFVLNLVLMLIDDSAYLM